MTAVRRGAGPLARRVFRLLLRAYPRAFRERYGREMEQLFRDAYPAHGAGTAGAVAHWARTIADIAFTASHEHAAQFSERRRRARRERRARTHARPEEQSGEGDGMAALTQDLRYALRTLRRNPGFALVVVISLALGIGANSLIYSVVDGIIFRPFPYPDADRLLAMGVTYPKLGGERRFIEAISPPEYEEIQAGVRTLERFFAFDLGNRNLSGGDRPERVFTAFIWGDPLATIGVRPALGRSFRPEETTTEGPPIALLSHRVWQSRFGGDSGIVGRTVQVNGVTTDVVGVMPPGILLAGTDLWLPMGVDPAKIPRQARQWTVIARLRHRATVRQANAELATLAANIERAHGTERKEYEAWRLEADTWANAVVGEMRPAATILLGTVGFVLLIACANIASVLLARAASRQRELAVRRALGAGRWRIARQLLTESLLLAAAGAVAGLGLAYLLLQPTTTLFPDQLRSAGVTATINGHVLLYTLGAAVLSGLIFGVGPAMQGVRGGSRQWLAGEAAAGRLTTSTGGRRVRNGFVVAEIALSLMLLVGAGVLVRSFMKLQRIDPGFDARNVLTMRLSLPQERYTQQQIGPFFEDLASRLAALPGVRAAAAATQFPPGNAFDRQMVIDGDAFATAEQVRMVDVTNVTEGYFGTLGYAHRAGRLFTAADAEQAPRVAIVNEAVVRRFFGAQNPIGKRIKLGEPAEAEWIEIVGVTADVRNRGLTAPVAPEVFIPVRQQRAAWNNQLFLTIRTQSDPMLLLPAVRRTIATLDPNQPVYAIRTLEDAFAESVAPRRAAMLLVSVFAGIALVLAAVGIYGLMSYMVNERTHEIGIRMALGAARGNVVALVVRETVKLIVIGVAIGLTGAVALGRLLQALVFEVRPSDPATIAAVSVLLAGVALCASLVPARRATRVPPIVALRSE